MNAQIALFVTDPMPPVAYLGNGSRDVQRRRAIAYSEPVKLELLAVAAARPDEWIQSSDFKVPREKYQIGFTLGHVLHALVEEGRMQVKKVYLGKGLTADRPGSADYQGYMNKWKIA